MITAVPVDQHCFRRAADSGAPHLGIDGHGTRHGEVGTGIDIDVANAFEMREHRHPCFRLDPAHETPPAARNNDIDGAVEAAEQQPDRQAVGGRHQLDGVNRKAGTVQAFAETGGNGARALKAVRPAAQHGGIAGFDAEARCIRRDIGPALENDADHPDWDADPRNLEPVRSDPLRTDAPDRVGQSGYDLERLRHRLDAGRVEPQAIEERRRAAAAFGNRQVAGVRRRDRRLLLSEGFRHRLQGRILVRSGRQGETSGRFASPPPDRRHQRTGIFGNFGNRHLRQLSRMTRSSRCTISSRPL
jgi:hypothetical protein